MNSTPKYYRVIASDIPTPDLVAFKVYQDVTLWWLLCLVNGINDVTKDMSVGQLLVVPDKHDIQTFYKNFRKR